MLFLNVTSVASNHYHAKLGIFYDEQTKLKADSS